MSNSEFDPKDLELLKNNKSEFHPDDLKAATTSDGGDAEAPDTSISNTILHKLLAGASVGHSDEIAGLAASPTGAAQTIANMVGEQNMTPEAIKYQAARDRERATLEAQQQENPWTSGISEFVGSIPTMMAGGAALGAGAEALNAGRALTGVKMAGLTGAATGALAGEGQSTASNVKDVAKDTAIGAGLGGATGLALGQAGKALMGNAADIASGALPEGTPEVKGVMSNITESRPFQEMKRIYKNADMDTDTGAANKLRGISNEQEAGKILKANTAKAEELGKIHGEKVSASDPLKLQSVGVQPLEETPSQAAARAAASKEPEIQALDMINGEVKKAVATATEHSPEEVASQFGKVTKAPISPEALQKVTPLFAGEPGLVNEIQEALAKNPNSTFDDIYNTVQQNLQKSKYYTTDPITQEQTAMGIDLGKAANIEKAFTQAKEVLAVDNIVADSAAKNGGTAEPAKQALKDLMDQRLQLASTINTEKPMGISAYIQELNPRVLSPMDVDSANSLKALISKFASPDGTIAGPQKIPFRDAMFQFAKGEAQSGKPSQAMGDLARKIGQEVKGNINATSSESSEYFNIKALQKLLKIKPGENSVDTDNRVAANFASYLEKMNSGEGLKVGRMEDLMQKFVEANKDNPEILNSLQKISKNMELTDIYKMKQGGEGASLSGMLGRLATIFPVETAGKIATNPLIQTASGVAQTTSAKLANLSPEAWRVLGAHLTKISPRLGELATKAAETSDPIKKAALLNIMNQMPSFRDGLAKFAGIKND
jgi:hypothetical protein